MLLPAPPEQVRVLALALATPQPQVSRSVDLPQAPVSSLAQGTTGASPTQGVPKSGAGRGETRPGPVSVSLSRESMPLGSSCPQSRKGDHPGPSSPGLHGSPCGRWGEKGCLLQQLCAPGTPARGPPTPRDVLCLPISSVSPSGAPTRVTPYTWAPLRADDLDRQGIPLGGQRTPTDKGRPVPAFRALGGASKRGLYR